MRFSLKTLFCMILGAAVLLAVIRLPFFSRLSVAFPLLGIVLWNVLAVAALMCALASAEWLVRQMRR